MREFTPGRNPRGMSRFEVLVSAIIVAVFATLLLQRLLYYQEQMEKAAMEAMAKQLDSLLRIRAGELLLAGRTADLAALDGSNPFDLFAVAPAQYRGDTSRTAMRTVMRTASGATTAAAARCATGRPIGAT